MLPFATFLTTGAGVFAGGGLAGAAESLASADFVAGAGADLARGDGFAAGWFLATETCVEAMAGLRTGSGSSVSDSSVYDSDSESDIACWAPFATFLATGAGLFAAGGTGLDGAAEAAELSFFFLRLTLSLVLVVELKTQFLFKCDFDFCNQRRGVLR